ncbi:NDR1/HIN1-like protein 10 [Papaver somniferum]|uniref:NDR1/HIN1-like protein 10 n=1 Tax=Papaver somniferum TaxID=3469 RepID=UPI000E6F801F|nr:NDR1/HIN1-like protein 10 [Papaver somniferum]
MGCKFNPHLCWGCACFLVMFVGAVCLVVFLNVVPAKKMKFHVIDASLTEFYLTNEDILHYNLAVNISVRNSNKITQILYDNIRSKPSCYGNDLGFVSLPSFRQGTKNTTLLYPVFQGQTAIKLRGSHLRDFNNDQRDGSYSIYVHIYFSLQLKHAGGGRSIETDIRVKCGLLRLNLLDSSSSSSDKQSSETGNLFNTKRCKVYGTEQI